MGTSQLYMKENRHTLWENVGEKKNVRKLYVSFSLWDALIVAINVRK